MRPHPDDRCPATVSVLGKTVQCGGSAIRPHFIHKIYINKKNGVSVAITWAEDTREEKEDAERQS